MRRAALVGLAFIYCAAVAHADDTPKHWVVDYGRSHLDLDGTLNGHPLHNAAARFNAAIDLDPNHPETGSIIVTIDMGSLADGDAALNIPAFPQAQFAATAIRKLGPWKFAATGNLTVKGVSHPVTLPFTLAPEADHWRATGAVTLQPADFGIGPAADPVRNAVTVRVDIAAD